MLEQVEMTDAASEAPINLVFASNLSMLMRGRYNVASLSRVLGIHRTQLQRFLDGTSFPKPDDLRQVYEVFDLDARILTHRIEDLLQLRQVSFLNRLAEGLEPASQFDFPNGFYEEWQELKIKPAQFSCRLLHVKTVNNQRQTKVYLRQAAPGPDGNFKIVSGIKSNLGFAVHQVGGLFIVDRTQNSTRVKFTTLRCGYNGDQTLFPGYKSSVTSLFGGDRLMKPSVVLRHIGTDFRLALAVRRQSIFRKRARAPEIIQWLLSDLQDTNSSD